METDASIQGLGAVLSQLQDSGDIHPVAYASRALSATEKRYAITELETLAVVWAMSHYHAYLFGNDVTIYTDHSGEGSFGNSKSQVLNMHNDGVEFMGAVYEVYKLCISQEKKISMQMPSHAIPRVHQLKNKRKYKLFKLSLAIQHMTPSLMLEVIYQSSFLLTPLEPAIHKPMIWKQLSNQTLISKT